LLLNNLVSKYNKIKVFPVSFSIAFTVIARYQLRNF
jgi:hypothetical protein